MNDLFSAVYGRNLGTPSRGGMWSGDGSLSKCYLHKLYRIIRIFNLNVYPKRMKLVQVLSIRSHIIVSDSLARWPTGKVQRYINSSACETPGCKGESHLLRNDVDFLCTSTYQGESFLDYRHRATESFHGNQMNTSKPTDWIGCVAWPSHIHRPLKLKHL